MTAPPIIQDKQPGRIVLIIWAVAATVAALVSTGFAAFLWLQTRQAPAPQTTVASPSSPFLALPESVIPGRYKWVSKSGNESFMLLNEDHTFTKEGTNPNPGHRWELTRDALVIIWLRSQNRLNSFERPGVYVETKDGVEVARMEKQE